MGLLDWLLPGRVPPGADAPPADEHARMLDPHLRDDWLALPEAVREQVVANIQEGILTNGNLNDPDANLSATAGGSYFFRRLTASRRDMNPLIQDRANEIAFWLFDTNPLAKRVLELTRDYVLGAEVTVTAQADEDAERDALQERIDAFWTDPRNRLDLRLPDYVLEEELYGEICLSVAVNPKDGRVRLGYIDPAEIKEVLTDPMDAQRQLAVVLRSPNNAVTAEGAARDRRLKVVDVDLDPASATYGRLVGVETDALGNVLTKWEDKDPQGNVVATQPYLGACFLFQINKVSNAKRGRSDLLALADWVDAYDQMLFAGVDRALMMKNFIWDVTIKGANQKIIDDYKRLNPPPKPGTVRYHSDTVTWAAVSPDLNTADDQNAADLILSHIATGAGHAKTWLNGIMDVNRASAGALNDPALARLTRRQGHVRALVTALVTFALDQAELAGVLPRREQDDAAALPPPWPIGINLPDLKAVDLQGGGAALSQVVTALATAVQANILDEQTSQEVAVHMVREMGIEVDLTQMRERIEQDKQDGRDAAAAIGAAERANGFAKAAGGDTGDEGTDGAAPNAGERAERPK